MKQELLKNAGDTAGSGVLAITDVSREAAFLSAWLIHIANHRQVHSGSSTSVALLNH